MRRHHPKGSHLLLHRSLAIGQQLPPPAIASRYGHSLRPGGPVITFKSSSPKVLSPHCMQQLDRFSWKETSNNGNRDSTRLSQFGHTYTHSQREEREGAPFSPSTEKEGCKVSPASFTQSPVKAQTNLPHFLYWVIEWMSRQLFQPSLFYPWVNWRKLSLSHISLKPTSLRFSSASLLPPSLQTYMCIYSKHNFRLRMH